MTVDDFLSALAREVPETQGVVAEHMEEFDELILHLLVADLRRYGFDEFDSGRRDVLARLLNVIDRALLDGAEDVNNAMAVSFVEDTGWWIPETQPFIEVWPSGLRAEVERQRSWRSE